MKLNKREKNLLIALGVILLFWGYYRFILSFQWENLSAKQQDRDRYEDELNKIKTIVDSETDIDSKFAHINEEITGLSKKYFSKIDQSRFIILINELLEGTSLFVQNISFSPQRTEGIGDTQIEVMSVTLPYEGEYSSLLSFLEKIRNNSPKVIIQNLDIKIKEDKLLYGTMLLDFYSVPDLIDIEDSSISYLFDSSGINSDPFLSFENDFVIDDEEYEQIDLSNIKINFDSPRVLIEGFENNTLDFIPSHPSMKGELGTNKNSKQGNNSLGLYYNFPPIQDKKQVHAVFNNKAIISQPPESIGLWVYSYDATKHGIKLRVKDKKGERQDISLSESIDWIGWKHLKMNIPQDKLTFPIEVERILIDIDSPTHGKGTLLFDSLEVFYPIDTPSYSNNSNTSSGHQLYDVKEGDTLNSISKAFYNNTSNQDIIKKYNGIKSNSDLKPGKTIIIPDVSSEKED